MVPADAQEIGTLPVFAPAQAGHWLGADYLGRDMLARAPDSWYVTNSRQTIEAFHRAMGEATEAMLTILDGDPPETDLHHQVSPVTGGPV